MEMLVSGRVDSCSGGCCPSSSMFSVCRWLPLLAKQETSSTLQEPTAANRSMDPQVSEDTQHQPSVPLFSYKKEYKKRDMDK